MIYFLIVWVLAVCAHVMMCMIEGLSVEEVNTRLLFMSSALWKGDKALNPLRGYVMLRCYEFDGVQQCVVYSIYYNGTLVLTLGEGREECLSCGCL